jgi:transcriptional regulator with XRE-family HTH domain
MMSLTNYSDERKLLGQRLRLARQELGLTQTESALLLNKPQWFISRVERGLRKLDVFELIEISQIYSKSVSYFLDNISIK